MMYTIYRNGKPYGNPSSSLGFLEYGLSLLKAQHIDDEWEIKEVKKEDTNG